MMPQAVAPIARVAPKRTEPERKRLGPVFETRNNMSVVVEPRRPRDPPAGSVDLRSLRYLPDATAQWGQHVRLQDCVTTVNASYSDLAELVAESLGRLLRELRAGVEEKIADTNTKVAALQLENATLRTAIAELALSVERSRPRASPRRKRAPAAGAPVETPP
jgi:hypothetical protein